MRSPRTDDPSFARLQRAIEVRRDAGPPPRTTQPGARCEVCDRAFALVGGMCEGCRARMLAGVTNRDAAHGATEPRPSSSLVQRMPGVLYRASPDRWRRLSFVSDGIAGLCGIPVVEFRAGRVGLARVTHPDDVDRVRDALRRPEVVRGYELEYRVVTASGEERWVHDRGQRSGVTSPAWDEGLLIDVTDKRRTYEQLLHEARHDALTGAANRRAFTDRLAEECARASRTEVGICVVAVDADHFKDVNDTHGHDVGDRVLVGLAERLTATVRVYDLVARMGGEEFAVLLIGVSQAEGVKLAERMRTAIAGSPLAGLPVTISAGCAAWHAGDTPEALLKRADTALYEAKRAGRNRVIAAPDPESAAAQ